MKSMKAFEARTIAEERTSIVLELVRLGQNALEDIARICRMTLEQVQDLAATLQH